MNRATTSEQRFSLLDQIPVGLCVLRQDLTVIFWNRSLEVWTHLSRDQMLGVEIGIHFPFLHDLPYQAALQQVFAGGESTVFSLEHQPPLMAVESFFGQHHIQQITISGISAADGLSCDAMLSVQNLVISDSQPLAVLPGETSLDPAQLERQVSASNPDNQGIEPLQTSEERFRALVQNASDITTVLTSEGTIFYQSPSIERVLGYPPAHFINHCVFDWLHFDDVMETRARFNALLHNPDMVLRMESRWRHADGSWIYLESVGSNQLDNSSVGGIVLNIRNISDRKKIEEALRQSQEQLNSILNSLDDVVWSVSAQTGAVLYHSPNTEKLYGRPMTEFYNNLNLWLEVVHPADRQWALQACQTLQKSGSQDVEYRIVRPDGELRWVRDRARLICDEAGHPIRIDTVITDLTGRKRAETALEQQLQKALLLKHITEEIRQSLDTQQIFRTTATQIGRTFQISRCVIGTYLITSTPTVVFVAEYLEPGLKSILGMEIPVQDEPYAQLVLEQDRAVASADVRADPSLQRGAALCRWMGLKSSLSVRTSYQGEPNGVISLHQCDRIRHWTKDEIELLEAVAAQVGIALTQAYLLEQETRQREELTLKNTALEEARWEA